MSTDTMQFPSPMPSPLPLFPLAAVLFPDGYLPLRIFEVRYLDLIGRCHKHGLPFGVVSLTQGAEVRVAGAGAESFAAIGTLAAIRSFEAPQSGLMQIECIGTQRFRVRSSELQKHGLWTAEVEPVAGDVALEVPGDLQHAADALRRLVGTLEERRRLEDKDGLRLPVAGPYRFDDCGWVANRWCELLPMQTELKQRLMELDSPLMRLELVSDLLARNGIAG
jgi:Lon protease-like protein